MKRFLAGLAALLPVVAMATPAGDFDTLTAAVDFADVGTAVVAIAAALAAALVIKKGARLVLSMIGR